MDTEALIKELDSDASGGSELDVSASLEISEDMRSRAARVKPNRRADGLEYGHKERRPTRLTAKQQAFASLIAQGHSPKEAYRKAYDVRSDNDATAITAANKLMRDSRIIALTSSVFESVKENIIQDAVATRRHVMTELFKHAEDAKQDAIKLKALELMGRAVGMFTDKVEQKVEEISTERLKKELQSSLALLDNVTHIKKRSA